VLYKSAEGTHKQGARCRNSFIIDQAQVCSSLKISHRRLQVSKKLIDRNRSALVCAVVRASAIKKNLAVPEAASFGGGGGIRSREHCQREPSLVQHQSCRHSRWMRARASINLKLSK